MGTRPRRHARFERNDSGTALISPSLGPAASETLHGSGTGSIALGGSTRGLSGSQLGAIGAHGANSATSGAQATMYVDDGDTPRTYSKSGGGGSKPSFPE